jgi:hypothetical protein
MALWYFGSLVLRDFALWQSGWLLSEKLKLLFAANLMCYFYSSVVIPAPVRALSGIGQESIFKVGLPASGGDR